MTGLITKGVSGFYYVDAEDGNLYECRARGILRLRGVTPLAGDVAEISVLEDGKGSLERILPRKNSFDRPPIANVDVMILVAAAAHPDPNFGIIDRFAAAAEAAGTEVYLCVNKTDIASPEILKRFGNIYASVYPLFFMSGKTGEGVEKLKSAIAGKKAAMSGPSGVGKSTLSNLLLGEDRAEVGRISDKLRRGKNTTRISELFKGDGFCLFDTPGFTSFDLRDVEPEALAGLFPDFAKYLGKCRFSDCRHLCEPGCAVAEAVENGFISRERYASYEDIYRESCDKRKY